MGPSTRGRSRLGVLGKDPHHTLLLVSKVLCYSRLYNVEVPSEGTGVGGGEF